MSVFSGRGVARHGNGPWPERHALPLRLVVGAGAYKWLHNTPAVAAGPKPDGRDADPIVVVRARSQANCETTAMTQASPRGHEGRAIGSS